MTTCAACWTPPRGALSTRDALRVPSWPTGALSPWLRGGPARVSPGGGFALSSESLQDIWAGDGGAVNLQSVTRRRATWQSPPGPTTTLPWPGPTGPAGERDALNLAPWLALRVAALLLTEWLLYRRRFRGQQYPSPPSATRVVVQPALEVGCAVTVCAKAHGVVHLGQGHHALVGIAAAPGTRAANSRGFAGPLVKAVPCQQQQQLKVQAASRRLPSPPMPCMILSRVSAAGDGSTIHNSGSKGRQQQRGTEEAARGRNDGIHSWHPAKPCRWRPPLRRTCQLRSDHAALLFRIKVIDPVRAALVRLGLGFRLRFRLVGRRVFGVGAGSAVIAAAARPVRLASSGDQPWP